MTHPQQQIAAAPPQSSEILAFQQRASLALQRARQSVDEAGMRALKTVLEFRLKLADKDLRLCQPSELLKVQGRVEVLAQLLMEIYDESH